MKMQESSCRPGNFRPGTKFYARVIDCDMLANSGRIETSSWAFPAVEPEQRAEGFPHGALKFAHLASGKLRFSQPSDSLLDHLAPEKPRFPQLSDSLWDQTGVPEEM